MKKMIVVFACVAHTTVFGMHQICTHLVPIDGLLAKSLDKANEQQVRLVDLQKESNELQREANRQQERFNDLFEMVALLKGRRLCSNWDRLDTKDGRKSSCDLINQRYEELIKKTYNS